MPVVPSRNITYSNNLQARYPEDVRTIAVRLPPNVSYPAGQVLAEAGNIAARNEVQTVTITGTPTGGSFPLTYPRSGTITVPYNSTAAQLQAQLDATIGAGNSVVTGGALPGTALTITYANEWGNRDVAAPTTSSTGLTGGTSPAVAVATTTSGSAGATEVMTAVNDAASDGTQIPKGILTENVLTSDNGCVVDQFGSANGETVPMAIAGEYPCSNLTGLVANHVTEGNAKKFGRLTSGNAITDSGAVIKIGL